MRDGHPRAPFRQIDGAFRFLAKDFPFRNFRGSFLQRIGIIKGGMISFIKVGSWEVTLFMIWRYLGWPQI